MQGRSSVDSRLFYFVACLLFQTYVPTAPTLTSTAYGSHNYSILLSLSLNYAELKAHFFC